LGNKTYTEQEIIRGCRKQRRRYQELLYHQFYGFGMSICLRYAYSRDDAMEILNDSFMKVFESIKSFDESKPFKSWFRRILVNTALDHYRANRKYRINMTLDELDPDAGPTTDENLALDAGEILGLFDRIPAIYRITFNLYEVEGYSHEEIAGMLDVSPGTSRSNLSRAKKMLRGLYLDQRNKSCHEAV
jgi:RNA polymerase sigma factor (sigma-70 family)